MQGVERPDCPGEGAVIFLPLPLLASALGWELLLPLPTPKTRPCSHPGLAQVHPQPWAGVRGAIARELLPRARRADRNWQRPVCVWGGGYTCLSPLPEIQGDLRLAPAPATAASPTFQPGCSLEPRKDWPPASPEWKCTREKDPARDPGEGPSLPCSTPLTPPFLVTPRSGASSACRGAAGACWKGLQRAGEGAAYVASKLASGPGNVGAGVARRP